MKTYKAQYAEEKYRRFTDWEGNEQFWTPERFIIEQATLLYMLPVRPNKEGTHMWRKWW